MNYEEVFKKFNFCSLVFVLGMVLFNNSSSYYEVKKCFKTRKGWT